MYWALQQPSEHYTQSSDAISMFELNTILEKCDIPHSFHKVVPFIGELLPDLSVDGNVILIGSYSMRHVAKRKGWVPGVFDLEDFSLVDASKHCEGMMLNEDSIFCHFDNVPSHWQHSEPMFIRPIHDSKVFAGGVMSKHEFNVWHSKVMKLKEDEGTTLDGNTRVLIAKPKHIREEFRVWVVDNRIVTASLYKRGNRVLYSSDVDYDVYEFVTEAIKKFVPERAFVIDVCRVERNELKIVEYNNFNSAGFYKGNLFHIVQAIEDMKF